MSIIDVPCDGRVGFHRMDVHLLRDNLLDEETRHPSPSFGYAEGLRAVATYLRPVAYLARGLGT